LLNKPLDNLYFGGDIEILRLFACDFPREFILADGDKQILLIDEIIASKGEISKTLLNSYSKSLQKAVENVFGTTDYGDRNFELSRQFVANVNRFAAYKAYHVTQSVRRQQADRDGAVRSDNDFYSYAQQVLNTANRYQAAEYHAAIARSRTAKQWQEFQDDPDVPNLKWIPSRSANPRESHKKFYGLVLPKNHPFWQTNQPGNIWNCKCDWVETFDDSAEKAPPAVPPAQGLEGNPAQTGELFTDNASYFKVNKEVDKIINRFFINEERSRVSEEFERTNKKEDYGNLASGVFLDSTKSFTKRLLHHVYNDKEIAAATVLPYSIGKLTNPIPHPLGEGKDMNLEKNIKNIEEKKKRGVVMYYKYEWIFAGKEYIVVMEAHQQNAVSMHKY
jgi:hypothetical protein